LEGTRVASCRALEITTPDEYDKNSCDQNFMPIGTRPLKEKIKNPGFVFLTLAPRGWVYQNMAAIARLDQRVIDCFDRTNHLVLPAQADSAFAAVESAAKHPSPYTLLAGIMVFNYSHASRALVVNQTHANLAQIVCALERYHFAHSKYPESLDALKPQYIDRLPLDIIGGQPLKYRKEQDRFLLYSVGWNGKDDGGVPDPGKTYSLEAKGDIVWPYREIMFK
jgi:hypothetical protein